MASMAVPRPLLIALLASVLAAVAFFATRGGASESTSLSPPPTASAPKPLKTVPPSKDGAAKGSDKAGSGTSDSTKSPADHSTKSVPKPAIKPKPATVTGVPQGVGRALAERKVVVVFFRQSGGDDSATAAAVATARHQKGVSVFSDSINSLGRYPRLVGGLGVSQAPSVVVVGPSRSATLLEGYTDAGTLKQKVLDAR